MAPSVSFKMENNNLDRNYHKPKCFCHHLSADEEIILILNAMQEYHDKTCVRFRPYVKTDPSWIDIKVITN